MVFPDELSKNRARPFGRPASRESQSLQLAQAHVAGISLETLPNDIVGEQRLTLFQDLFAKATIKQ
jgi:hypothetical protein